MSIQRLGNESRDPEILACLSISKSLDLGIPFPGFSGLKFAITIPVINPI